MSFTYGNKDQVPFHCLPLSYYTDSPCLLKTKQAKSHSMLVFKPSSSYPTVSPSANLTSAQRNALFSGSVGLMIQPPQPQQPQPPQSQKSHPPRNLNRSTKTTPTRTPSTPPPPTQNPTFLMAMLDEHTLREILCFNRTALHFIPSHAVVNRLRAIERDPEYVLTFLGDWELVRVLEVFWESWRDSGGADSADADEWGDGGGGGGGATKAKRVMNKSHNEKTGKY